MDAVPNRISLSDEPRVSLVESNGNGSANGADRREAVSTASPPENALNDIIEGLDKDKFTSSKGIVFKLKPVASSLIMEASRKLRPPPVPTYWNEADERELENPAHPEYIAAMNDFNMQRAAIVGTAQMGFGTEVISIPDGIEPWDSEAWATEFEEALEITIPTRGKARYASWLRLYALTDTDHGNLMRAVQRISGGVAEDEVKTAEDSFRNTEERRTDTGAPA